MLTSSEELLWANPPFSKLSRVDTKIALDKCKMVLLTPDWGFSAPNGHWRSILDQLTVKRVPLPDTKLFEKFGDPENLLPKPHWGSFLSLVDGEQNFVSEEDLDPSLVKVVKEEKQIFG